VSETIWHITMSLDGFIAGPGDGMEWAGGHIHGPNPMADAARDATGAILAGRRWHDIAIGQYDGVAGIYGGRWTGPVFVLTHRPEDTPGPGVRFLSGSVEDAVATAKAAAGGRAIGVFGASLAAQCLAAGLLDEIVVHIAPVLLGDGVRLFGGAGVGPVALERVEQTASGQVTNLRVRVVT
jgi:dihydrofolate reductase